MKLLFTIVMISFLLMCSAAHADWAEDFIAAVAQRGTDAAVQEAFEAGVSPADIMAVVQQTGAVEIEPESVIKALYCSGVRGPVVQAAAADVGVAESVVAIGFQQSVQQCGPAGRLTSDPFSRTDEIAGGGTTFRGEGGFPDPPPDGGGGAPPPVILPPVDGGDGGSRPPSASPSRPN